MALILKRLRMCSPIVKSSIVPWTHVAIDMEKPLAAGIQAYPIARNPQGAIAWRRLGPIHDPIGFGKLPRRHNALRLFRPTGRKHYHATYPSAFNSPGSA